MESIRRIRRSSSLLYDRLRKQKEDSKAPPTTVELLTTVRVETKTVLWTIENVNRCPTDLEDYIESPVFCTGSGEVTEWRLRFYPRCKDDKKDENPRPGLHGDPYQPVAMYLLKITPGTRVHLEFSLTLVDNSGSELAVFRSDEKSLICTGAAQIGQKTRVSKGQCLLKYSNDLRLKCELTVGSMPDSQEEELRMPVLCHCRISSDFARLHSSGLFSDAVLQVGKRQFRAHRAVLAARSKVFRKTFEHQMKEDNGSGVINVEKADPTTMEAVLRYIYSGKAEDLDVDRAIKVFAVADEYELLELKALCSAFLLKQLSVDNACSVAVLADLHSETRMLEAAVRFIRANSTLVFDRAEWNVLTEERPLLATNILKEIAISFRTDCAKK